MEPTLPTVNVTKRIDDVLDITRQYHNLLERQENDAATTYIWDGGLLFATHGQWTNEYLLDDLGSPLRFGQLKMYAYDEFGNAQGSTLGGVQPFGFTGYQHDGVAGTWYAQAREYDAQHGRFVAQDVVKGVVTHPFTLNAYTYCWNQPLDLVDLDGLAPCPGHGVSTQPRATSESYFYIFHGSDQACAAALYRRQLEAAHPDIPVRMIPVSSEDDLIQGWAGMGSHSNGNISGVIMNVHGTQSELRTCRVYDHMYVSNLVAQERRPSVPWLILLSCNTGHMDVQDNVASQFARYLVDGPVISVDGNHRRFNVPDFLFLQLRLPFMNNSVGTGWWFKRDAYVCGISNVRRDPLGFILFYLSGEDVNSRILDIHSVWSLLHLIEQIDLHNRNALLRDMILAAMLAAIEGIGGLGCEE